MIPALLGCCCLQLRRAQQLRAWRTDELNVCSFSNIASHRNRSLLFLKHLPVRTVTRKYRVRQHYTQRMADECSASRPGRVIPEEISHGTHWIGSSVGLTAGLDTVEREKKTCLPGNRTQVVQPIARRYTD
jgi:hypothetical protein